MTYAAFGFAVWALAVTGYSIRKIRVFRAVLQREHAIQFKAQVRRADAWGEFCDPCKKIAAPWWTK